MTQREKSLSFDHSLIKNIKIKSKIMIAGNIKIDDILNFKNNEYIIDVSGGLEDNNGKKDINKIDELARDIEIPKTLRELDITKKNLEVMSKDAAESNQVKTNPVQPTENDLKKLYEELL